MWKWSSVVLVIVAGSACTTFVPVRPGAAQDGTSVHIRMTMATPPGDDAAWFWSFWCAHECDRAVGGVEVDAGHGTGGGQDTGWEFGGGFSGVFPYLRGHVELNGGERSVGVGGRFTLPVPNWRQDMAYVAYDLSSSDSKTEAYGTTTLFRHGGHSPNGVQRGSFWAIAQGFGFAIDGFRPELALVIGRTRRGALGGPTAFGYGPYRETTASTTAFLVLGASVDIIGR